MYLQVIFLGKNFQIKTVNFVTAKFSPQHIFQSIDCHGHLCSDQVLKQDIKYSIFQGYTYYNLCSMLRFINKNEINKQN